MSVAFAPPLVGPSISRRDRRILALTRRLLGSGPVDFGEALRALKEATEALIPAGRIYVLGSSGGSPVAGSIISGVGLALDGEGGRIAVVRVGRGDGRIARLGSFSR
jgi:hypothetical protein